MHIAPTTQDLVEMDDAKDITSPDEEPAFGARIYYRNILDRYPQTAHYLARRLAEANWHRANRLRTAKFPDFRNSSPTPSSSSGRGSVAGSELAPSDPLHAAEDPTFPYDSPSRSETHVCKRCGRSFRHLKRLRRHERRTRCAPKRFKCPDCGSAFPTKDQYERHWHLRHSAVAYNCPECSRKSTTTQDLRKDLHLEHPNSIYSLFDLGFASSEEIAMESMTDPQAGIQALKDPFRDSGAVEGRSGRPRRSTSSNKFVPARPKVKETWKWSNSLRSTDPKGPQPSEDQSNWHNAEDPDTLRFLSAEQNLEVEENGTPLPDVNFKGFTFNTMKNEEVPPDAFDIPVFREYSETVLDQVDTMPLSSSPVYDQHDSRHGGSGADSVTDFWTGGLRNSRRGSLSQA